MPTEIDREENVEKVINAATYCLKKYGISKTTQSLLAEKAGVSAKSVKRYFETREDLLFAVSRRILESWDRKISDDLDKNTYESKNGMEQLKQFLFSMTKVILKSYDELVFIQDADFYCRHSDLSECAYWENFRETKHMDAKIIHAIQSGILDGSIKHYKDVEGLALSVTSACVGFAEHTANNIKFGRVSYNKSLMILKKFIDKADILLGTDETAERLAIQEHNNCFADEFKKALAMDQFVLYLLPKFHMNGDLYGAEVLVRWNHPDRGFLQPQEFIPLCIQENLMYDLDFYVWEHACQLLAKWKARKMVPCTFSVKVSEQSLYHFKTADSLMGLLEKYGIDKTCLQLEIEEDSIRKDLYQAKDAIDYLRNLGFIVLLDDFSYGCSSISALNQIAVDVLKVDMKFFTNCNNAGMGEAILGSIMKCVSWHGTKVLAECVETKEQYNFAKIRKCDFVQGFYFSKPIDVQEFDKIYLNTRPAEALHEKAQDSETNPLHDLTVLVVDDTERERALLKKYLQTEFHVELCDSAEAGLEYLRNHLNHVDVILVDYMMPKMNGIEFLEICKLDERLNIIPKIMITSNERAKDQILAFQAGAYDYLLKPLIPELVRVRVRHALELNHKLMSIEHEKQEFQHLAETDKATGVLNKISFETKVKKHLSSAATSESALLIIDIDDFKLVNDTQGHLVGDEVIKWIADQLTKNFRSSDYVGRFGGDEFIVYMMQVPNHSMVEEKARKLIRIMNQESENIFGFPVSVSIGIGYTKEHDFFHDLFERTDAALYQVKKSGKGRYL